MAPAPVELAGHGGTVVRGLRWDDGDGWLVLLHEHGRDLDRFRPFAERLAAHGLSALALDRRGHGGSDGEPGDAAAEHEDVRSAIRYVREHGADCVIVVAAGDAALVALEAVHLDPPDAYVLLSPAPADAERLRGLRGAGRPKLVLVGRDDRTADAAASALQRVSIGWSLAIGLPTARQGADLLEGEPAAHASEQIVRFTAETRWLTAGAAAGSAA